jgi:peptidoglycan biosynthesis protein MviN/MurJ (putative lipid II flippase)
VMTARGDTRWLWYISLAELAVNIIASLVLLSAFGLAGIAMGTFIAFAFEKIVLTIFVYRRYDIPFTRMINPVVWLSYALLIMSTFIAARWIFGV